MGEIDHKKKGRKGQRNRALKANPELDALELKVLAEYKKDLSLKRAYFRAAGTCETLQGAAVSMNQWRKNPAKKYFFQELRKVELEQAKKISLEADDILREILYIAKADISEAYEDNGDLKPISEWPPELKKCLAGISKSQSSGKDGESISITTKFHPKLKALEMLAKHLNLLVEKVELSFNEDTAARLERARAKRLEEKND